MSETAPPPTVEKGALAESPPTVEKGADDPTPKAQSDADDSSEDEETQIGFVVLRCLRNGNPVQFAEFDGTPIRLDFASHGVFDVIYPDFENGDMMCVFRDVELRYIYDQIEKFKEYDYLEFSICSKAGKVVQKRINLVFDLDCINNIFRFRDKQKGVDLETLEGIELEDIDHIDVKPGRYSSDAEWYSWNCTTLS